MAEAGIAPEKFSGVILASPLYYSSSGIDFLVLSFWELHTKMGMVVFRILLVFAPLAVWMVTLAPMEGVAVAGNRATGREVFLQNCALCHVSGVAMAPRMDNLVEWEPRLSVGRQNLLNSVLRGKGGMPPKGGNASISDAQAAAGLDYMLEQMTELKSQIYMAQGR